MVQRARSLPRSSRQTSVSKATHGPLLLHGEVEIRDAAGESSYSGNKTALCRCGRSANKPFCDGSHARTGWRDDL